MNSNENKAKELETTPDEALDSVAGGGGDITYIICHTCGFELPISGQHNFVNKCPRCGGPMKTW